MSRTFYLIENGEPVEYYYHLTTWGHDDSSKSPLEAMQTLLGFRPLGTYCPWVLGHMIHEIDEDTIRFVTRLDLTRDGEESIAYLDAMRDEDGTLHYYSGYQLRAGWDSHDVFYGFHHHVALPLYRTMIRTLNPDMQDLAHFYPTFRAMVHTFTKGVST